MRVGVRKFFQTFRYRDRTFGREETNRAARVELFRSVARPLGSRSRASRARMDRDAHKIALGIVRVRRGSNREIAGDG